MEKEKKRDWSKSNYSKLVRISPENYEWIKINKGKFSIAGKLNEIINKLKNKYNDKQNN